MQDTIAAIWAKAAEFDPGSSPTLEKKYVQQQRAVLARLIDAYLDAGDEPRAELLHRMLARQTDGHFWIARYNREMGAWRTHGLTPYRADEIFGGETLQQFFERLAAAVGLK